MRLGPSAIGPGRGLASAAPRGVAWTPLALLASWVLDPQGFTGLDITAASSRYTSTTMTAASGREAVQVVGDAAQYEIERAAEPFVGYTVSPFTGIVAMRTKPTTKLWSPDGGPLGAEPWTRVTYVQRRGTVPAAGSATHSLFGEPNAYNVGLGSTTASAVSTFGNGSGTGLQTPSAVNSTDMRPHYVVEQYNGVTLTVSLDGKVLGGPIAKTYAFITRAFGYGPWFYLPGNATYDVQGAIVHRQTIVVGRNISAADLALLLRFDLVACTTVAGGPRAVVCFGDSLTQGTAVGSEPLTVSIYAVEVAPNIFICDNQGISGLRSDQVRDIVLAYTGIANFAHLMCGVNHTLTPDTPTADAAGVHADLILMVAYLRGRGIVPVISTLPQWYECTTTPNLEAYRVALNALIVDGAAAGNYRVANVSAAWGGYVALRFVDGTHPTATAQRTYTTPSIRDALNGAT